MAIGSSGRRIVVEFVGDASALRGGVKDAEGALGSFSGKAQAAGRIAGKALAGGLLLAGAAAVSATKAAAEDEAAQSQLATQLRNTTGATDKQIDSVENYISSLSLATGVADDELRPSLAKLATATGDVTQAIGLQRLAMDVAAGTGKTLAQVTDAFVKAQNGSVGGLSRLGVATKKATGESKGFAAIQNDLATKYAGASARAAETTAGKTKIMAVQFEELKEKIGTQLLPVMTKLAEVGLKVVGWISENTRTVGIFIGVLGSLLAITTAVGYATKAVTAAQMIWKAATAAFTAVQWLMNAALTANPIGLVVIAIAALVAGLILAYKHSETFRNIVNAAFGAIKNVVLAVVGWFGKWVPEVFAAVGAAIKTYVTTYKAVILAVWDAIVGAVRAVLGVYRSVIVTAFNGIKDYFQTTVAVWKMIFNNAWDAIKAAFQNAKQALSSIAGNIRDAVSNAFEPIKSVIQGVIDKVQWLIDKIGDLISKIKSIPHPDIPGLKISGKSAIGSGRGAAGGTKDAIVGGLGVVGAVGGLVGRAGAAGPGGGDTVVININGALDPDGVAKSVEQMLRRRERSTGRQLLVSRA